MFKKINRKNKKGFTLAELLIVVAIIGVLVAISIPIFTAQLEKSRDATTESNVRAAYAEAQAAWLTGESDAPNGVTVAKSSTDAASGTVVVNGVVARGAQTGGTWLTDLPQNGGTTKITWNLSDMDNGPGTYNLTFTYANDILTTVDCAKAS